MGGTDENEQDLELTELPAPKKFVVTPVPDGDYRNHLPTITAVYIGCKEVPNGESLLRVHWADLERGPAGAMRLCLFFAPEHAEGADLGTTLAYELNGPEKTVDQFWEGLVKIKCFVFEATADEYIFRCRVDAESQVVTDSSCVYRFLN